MILECFIMELILLIAPEYNIPPYLVAAIIIKESQGNVYAIAHNNNGSIDYGLMQLNSSWFNDENWNCPEVNIRAGMKHLSELYSKTKRSSPYWWSAIVAYNCGLGRFLSDRGPPEMSLNYADDIIRIWKDLEVTVR